MNTNLTDQDRADLAQFLREAIDADRWPLSPRVRRLKELLAKIDPAAVPAVTRYPAPRPPGQPPADPDGAVRPPERLAARIASDATAAPSMRVAGPTSRC